ncbi:MAG: hypothetical protein NTY22_04160 [Proteobacteria bacterium]|nr:hypothetical protein [Pseudomonadota bacterium]
MKLFATLPGELLSLMRSLGEAADSMNAKAYIIGAYPRSILVKEDCSDLEITVTGDCQKMVDYFVKNYALIKSKKVYSEGRYTFVPSPYNDGDFLRIAPARKDEKGGVGDIYSETLSRGFSIDALTISLSKNDFGTVIDPVGAADDIKIKSLRILHRDVFEQEPRFIFKAFYYISRYGLSWDHMTENLWRKALKNGVHLKLSSKEIDTEIKLIKKEKNGKDVLKLLEEYNV